MNDLTKFGFEIPKTVTKALQKFEPRYSQTKKTFTFAAETLPGYADKI